MLVSSKRKGEGTGGEAKFGDGEKAKAKVEGS